MPGKYLATWATKPLAVAALIAGLALPLPARAETPSQSCDAATDLVHLIHPLPRVAHKMALHETITIVAIGSSSTAGAGATSPTANYPSRLAVELKTQFPNQPIVVVNRGVNGEEIGDMLKRFDASVIAAKPDLVLWQLGTNSVIREQVFTDRGDAIREGLKKLRAIGADVVLIDPQFVPKVIEKPEAVRMVELIAATAKQEDVDLFRRFELMKRWHDVDHQDFSLFVSPDGLHLNDWGYACMAKGLAMGIAEAAQRPVLSATVGAHLMVP